MAIAALLANEGKGMAFARKATSIKRLAKYLVKKCQGISEDRQNLWRIYDESSYAHSLPKCVWRRHGALLMYARYHNPAMERPVNGKSH
jgi:hypothetical protein